MTTAQVKEMLAHGVTMGNHTRTQAYLPSLPEAGQREEVFGNKGLMGNELGIEVNFFAYPSGGFSEGIKAIVKEAGHKAALATNRGYDRFNKDLFELNRIRFSDKDDSDFVLSVKLSGYYNLFREPKAPY